AFAERLSSTDGECCIKELQEMPVTALQPRTHTLRVLAGLLTSDDPDITKAVSSFLSNAASYPGFRSKAVQCYTQTLSEAGVAAQRAACVALSCLQAVESITAVVNLCDAADEELRHTAIQTLLTF
ncbi:protein FAM65B isoform X2, partial [Silurus asotus]